MQSKLLAIIVLALSGCAATSLGDASDGEATKRFAFEVGAAQSIAPAPEPQQQDWASFDVIGVDSGARERIKITPFGQSGVRGRFADGCAWTRQADWFSPSDSWAFCGTSETWRTAQATVERTGALWPLTVGATAAYVREARSSKTGEISRRTTTCDVVDAVDVRRASGAIAATFKVRCDDGRRVRTSWWSPEAGLLFFRQEHRSRGVERFWERIVE